MRLGAKAKGRDAAAFPAQYRSALRAYAERGSESALLKGYELGRQAIDEGRSLIEVVSLFEAEVAELSATKGGQEERIRALNNASRFLAESLSPYEMAHRGFRDAVKALRRFNEILEEEIKRIAHAVHDDAGQSLVVVHLALADLSRSLPPEQREQVAKIEHSLDQVEKQLRRYSHELRPTVLDDLGLVPAIRFMAGNVSGRTGLRITVTAKVAKRLPSAIEIALYRIVQEALTNITKHASATVATVEAFCEGGELCCAITDDGTGFDVNAIRSGRVHSGIGLIGIEERAHAIGGTLSIESAPGRGTKILVRVRDPQEQVWQSE